MFLQFRALLQNMKVCIDCCLSLPVLALNFLLLFSGTLVFPLPSFRLWRFPVDGLFLEILPHPTPRTPVLSDGKSQPIVARAVFHSVRIVHTTLSLTVKRLIVKMRSDLNSRNLQRSASLFVYHQLLHSIAN